MCSKFKMVINKQISYVLTSLPKELGRDERRFRLADLDHDGSLDRAEFQAFVHPEVFNTQKSCS